MNPLPPAVAARWARNWSPEAHPERPWWCAVHSTIMSGSLVRWRRSDGRETDYYKVPVTWGTHDDPALFFLDTPRAELARIDAAHPLPAPPPMPAQVWAYPDGAEVCLIGVDVPPEMPPDAWGRARFSPCMWHEKGNDVWPPPGAILVAGPTPWGRDIPWSPA
jgi:hypothetical protein